MFYVILGFIAIASFIVFILRSPFLIFTVILMGIGFLLGGPIGSIIVLLCYMIIAGSMHK